MANLTVDSSLEETMGNLAVGTRPKYLEKRMSYIDWDSYFMAISCLVSNRSKDPSTQVGACIVNDKNRIVGQGYNGMPRGCRDDEFPWDKTSSNPLETKYFYVCHAEMNAIFNRNCADLSGHVIYTVLFPCNQCAKTIIQSGIKKVVYMGDKNITKTEALASKRMFKASGVTFKQFRPIWSGLEINFKTGVCEESSCDLSSKREKALPWDDYFIAICILVANRSKCPSLQMGACIVNEDNCIVGQGYNGMPLGCSDDDFPWGVDPDNKMENKDLYECHAELNAILNAGLSVKKCIIYTIEFPCNECAKAIIQSGIKEVRYLWSPNEKPEFAAALKMFDAAHIGLRQCKPQQDDIFVSFTLIDS